MVLSSKRILRRFNVDVWIDGGVFPSELSDGKIYDYPLGLFYIHFYPRTPKIFFNIGSADWIFHYK